MPRSAPIPENEEQRLEWLRQCAILDTLPETVFDEVTKLAARLCRTPIAAINLIDHDRQWSKSSVGQDKQQDSRDISFCAHAILQQDILVVPDAWSDQRFTDNPLVLGAPYIRFYAGAPLVTSEGFGIGSLCVVDSVPRQLTEEQVAVLRLLACQVVGRIELQRHVALQEELITDRERLLWEVRQAATQQRTLLRDVLSSVTGGRLRLCQEAGELPAVPGCSGEWVMLSSSGDLWTLRQNVESAAEAAGFPELRWRDLMTAASEAAMNAVVHGGGGRGRVCVSGDLLQVWVEDSGHGIAIDSLPQATLERGYTTAGTLGYGMKMMLDTVDRVFLLTGSSGTTVVLEQHPELPLPAWLSTHA